MATLHDFSATTIDGAEQSLRDYAGKVALVVNVASQCGLTPHYGGLEELYKEYKDRGLVVLGFPCNQFGGQEPGTESEIATFCETSFGVTFPLFRKVDVNGDTAAPLYRHLKSARPGLLGTEAIKWNFTKFLVGRDGQVLKRYAPNDAPKALRADIEKALAQKA